MGAELGFWSMVNNPDTRFWLDCGKTLYRGSTPGSQPEIKDAVPCQQLRTYVAPRANVTHLS